jgi:uncharacterized protein (TIGR02145 family)
MKHIYLLLLIYISSYAQQPCPGIPTVSYNGQTYHTVAIGDQCWLKENLNVGTMILGSQSPSNNSIIEKYCYQNNSVNCTTYGGLYQWNEAMQYVNTPGTKGICPNGWHIPSNAEYTILSNTVGGEGNALKSIGQGVDPGAGTNASGFSALMGGFRFYNNDSYSDLGGEAYFWSSSIYGLTNAFVMDLGGYLTDIYQYGVLQDYGFSVRCLNDMSVSNLPVELNLFSAVADGRTIELSWTTQTEKNSDKFVVERRTISADWVTIGSVKAAVLSNSPKQYSYTDKNLQSGKYLYRLKMIDNDGTYEYSKVIEAEVAVPNKYELNQNYPNPFNPSTVISYSLPMATIVKLIVYNSIGQTVQLLENGYKNAGTYTITFDASELTNGIYFYKIEAGKFIQVKKMILMK